MSINHIYYGLMMDCYLLNCIEAVIKHENGEINSKPLYSHFLGCSHVFQLISTWSNELLLSYLLPTCKLITTLWNTVCETNVGLLCKNYCCISKRRVGVFRLCQARGWDTSSALLPRDRRHSCDQQLHQKYGKQVPECKACTDCILGI